MKTIIWPVYIDSARTRKEGRKISKKDGVKSPKLSEISRAARKLDLKPDTENNKSYPGMWWESSGRIIVERKEMSKKDLLLKISNTINGSRSK
ncbi:MAG: signal recognition particle subunit SRP19/SEC65 family protein [Methanobacteriaceae archaeon]|nr:signal recognition particle subunit SRP19/SEC65 family protein [Methanobacteriaceae archaeon]